MLSPKKAQSVQLLRPDNFTAPSRTPWGGQRLLDHYKGDLGIEASGPVGESWEVSVSELPSSLAGGGSLEELFAEDPVHWLGERSASSLLVKLLDAALPLSVQIHPTDDDPVLAPDEGGKPEAWYILDADEGAGVYLGLADGVDEAAMSACLDEEGDVASLLRFVPATPGDFFLIAPRTPHAIGGGLTLIEPQRVRPGKRGLTYRYWDWNRRYDAKGKPDPAGQPRELHRERALAVTDWDRAWGDWLDGAHQRCGVPAPSAPAEATVLCEGPDLAVVRWAGTGALEVPEAPYLRSLTVAGGSIEVDGVLVKRGESAVIAASAGPLSARLDHAHALICWVSAA
ncbi:MAG: type I phosphomannose isomerase catalytic subunit [Myxococcota bacterium]